MNDNDTSRQRAPIGDAPAWVLDVAEDVMRYRLSRLSDEMLARDEDITNTPLWQLRRQQLDALLASGRVLAVKRGQGS